MSERVDTRVGHEASDVRVGPLIVSLALLAAGCFAALLLMRWLFVGLDDAARARDLPGHPLAAEHQVAPAPRLQADPPAEYRAWREAEERALAGYAWLDRDAGLVRLPVERALDLVLEEGLPARAGAAQHEGGGAGR